MMTYCYASGEREGRLASRDILLVDELFVFLVHLKLGFTPVITALLDLLE